MQVLRVPEVLAELSSNTLEGFVREQVAVLRDTGGGASTVPRLITDCLKHKVGPADIMSICIIQQLSDIMSICIITHLSRTKHSHS